jgi:hypothetical protein
MLRGSEAFTESKDPYDYPNAGKLVGVLRRTRRALRARLPRSA